MSLSIRRQAVTIRADKVDMDGMLALPDDLLGVVLFADGCAGNCLKSPSDYVGSVLHHARLGTLSVDLLAAGEGRSGRADLNAGVLTQRLHGVCHWLREQEATRELSIGLFGSGSGAAAALQLAAMRGHDIAAVVSRGGRPDLAAHGTLDRVSAPTLLIVGSLDDGVVDVNRAAYAALCCKKRLEIIPGATHSFEEPGSPEVVARLARGWFVQHADFAHA